MRRTIGQVLAEARARIDRVTPQQAWERMGQGWLLIDTRSSDERRLRGYVPGSVHIPLSVLEWRVDPTSGHSSRVVAGLEHRLILLCAEGYASSLAAIRLHELGFKGTTDVIGGFAAWRKDGLPIVHRS